MLDAADARRLMAPIHPPHAVILPRDLDPAWLDPEETGAAAVLPLPRPYVAEAMAAYPVSTAVNSPRNNSPALLTPLAAE
jgi:putative SOS response-associated peptidase YedK